MQISTSVGVFQVVRVLLWRTGNQLHHFKPREQINHRREESGQCLFVECVAGWGAERHMRRSAGDLALSTNLLVATSDKSVCRHSGFHMGSGWCAVSAACE